MNDLFSVDGKIAVVTGGGRGIGAMITTAFVKGGAKVYAVSRNPEPSEKLARELSGEKGECIPLQADLSSLAEIKKLAATLAEKESKIDILVNNAGAAAQTPMDDFSEEDWDVVMDVNSKSVFFTTQALLPLLRAGTSDDFNSRVINIASVNGVRPPEQPVYSYSASKAACLMVTRHMAKHLANEQILVNAITPGPFPTDMMAPAIKARGDAIAANNPLGRLGGPDDIAGAAIFLASRASAWTTGAVIPVDGGSAQVR